MKRKLRSQTIRTTRQWAKSHGVAVEEVLPLVKDYIDKYARSARQVAARTIVLHSVAAVGFGVPSPQVVEWLRDQQLWKHVSAQEKLFLQAAKRTKSQRAQAQWRSESEWALLWAIGKVECLGLPTTTCDTARLVDEIMPELGSDVSTFLSKAKLRPPAELLAEEDRTYNLHCYARIDLKRSAKLPQDLNYNVLYERHYAFDWLSGAASWDKITCDT